MSDWKAVASALAPEIPADQLERVTGPLASLEAEFRPLAAGLPVHVDPAFGVAMDEEPAE
jgi:hypothetical protein